ncbi:hypothetical protein NA57DRAFT_31239 [Rhizodiscina lignyota]|uniref:L-ornithine N(5)-oxygenase n=1 Tax=Rhizodiscina lignyota TaxID=1504668 RepID=A0A9P4IPS3_9PEZI|nr:hypothetical protein NA57DRAFT_31239 [Rhizodiscina lignyota]
MVRPLPEQVDTCIIGNGPSALILSYILHGHIPYYKGGHQDELLDSKLIGRRDLFDLSPDLYAHFQSSLRYSTQALPINTLLDTLLRPNADTEVNSTSLVEWKLEPRRAVSHVALGNAPHTGGQWVDNPVSASWEIGTLSYAEMLSLPGYSFAEHYSRRHGKQMADFQRPSRTEVADYYAAYPEAVGIESSIWTSTNVSSISRDGAKGFIVNVGSHALRCKHLVLATGIFSVVIPPPRFLAPVASLHNDRAPLLVIGSGFSAADVIISTSPRRRIIHIFHWDPENRPSPLKGCHRHAYPEYAGVYRQMKLSAIAATKGNLNGHAPAPGLRRKSSYFPGRDWENAYEGLPNAEVVDVKVDPDGDTAQVTIRQLDGATIIRTVGGLEYVVGRRAEMNYLSPSLQSEVVGSPGSTSTPGLISGKTLRSRAEEDLEIAPGVFIIGSLTGDSLVRHAFGGCVYAAGRIMGTMSKSAPPTPKLDGKVEADIRPNGIAHEDLHLDRRKMVQTR